MLENDKIFKFLKTILLDTFISEENNGVLYFFKKTRENLLFCHTNKVLFIESKKISLATRLATFPSFFFSPLNPQYSACIM